MESLTHLRYLKVHIVSYVVGNKEVGPELLIPLK